METFRFAHPEYLYILIVIPIAIFGFIITQIVRQRALKKFGNIETISQLMPFRSTRRPIIKFIISLLTITSIIIGIAQPQFGSKLKTVKRKGIELVIALDVSNSMLAEDIKPNRLERAKMSISKLIDNLDSDKIGLVVFAGDAYTQLPITSDYPSAKLFLKGINTNIIPIQGTAIGSAISLATNSFSPMFNGSKAIIVITDGENHEDDALNAATAAESQGIIVHTLGMGLPKGAPIPTSNKSGSKEYRTDRDGNTVITKLNEEMLAQVAAAGGGRYVRANNTQVGLNKILSDIESLEKEEMEDRVYSDYEDQFQYFFWFALILMCINFMMIDRKNRHIMKLNLFEKSNNKD